MSSKNVASSARTPAAESSSTGMVRRPRWRRARDRGAGRCRRARRGRGTGRRRCRPASRRRTRVRAGVRPGSPRPRRLASAARAPARWRLARRAAASAVESRPGSGPCPAQLGVGDAERAVVDRADQLGPRRPPMFASRTSVLGLGVAIAESAPPAQGGRREVARLGVAR